MLFVVLLGGKHAAAKIEVHDVVFATGARLQDTYPQLERQWFGARKGLHVDAWMAVDGVDGYRVLLSETQPAAGEPRLFFINLGSYVTGAFGEDHRYLLVVAQDAAEAKRKGKVRADAGWDKPHTDNLYDVDDCIPVDSVDGCFIQLVPGTHAGIEIFCDYLVLP